VPPACRPMCPGVSSCCGVGVGVGVGGGSSNVDAGWATGAVRGLPQLLIVQVVDVGGMYSTVLLLNPDTQCQLNYYSPLTTGQCMLLQLQALLYVRYRASTERRISSIAATGSSSGCLGSADGLAAGARHAGL
jgi:hypothetical protein